MSLRRASPLGRCREGPKLVLAALLALLGAGAEQLQPARCPEGYFPSSDFIWTCQGGKGSGAVTLEPGAAEVVLQVPSGTRGFGLGTFSDAKLGIELLDARRVALAAMFNYEGGHEDGAEVKYLYEGTTIKVNDGVHLPTEWRYSQVILAESSLPDRLNIQLRNQGQQPATVTMRYNYEAYGTDCPPPADMGCSAYDEAAAGRESSRWSCALQGQVSAEDIWADLLSNREKAHPLDEGEGADDTVDWVPWTMVWHKWMRGYGNHSAPRMSFTYLDQDRDMRLSRDEFRRGYDLCPRAEEAEEVADSRGMVIFYVLCLWTIALLLTSLAVFVYQRLKKDKSSGYFPGTLQLESGEGGYDFGEAASAETAMEAPRKAQEGVALPELGKTWVPQGARLEAPLLSPQPLEVKKMNRLGCGRGMRDCTGGGLLECMLRSPARKPAQAPAAAGQDMPQSATARQAQGAAMAFPGPAPTSAQEADTFAAAQASAQGREPSKPEPVEKVVLAMFRSQGNHLAQTKHCLALQDAISAGGKEAKARIVACGGTDAIVQAMTDGLKAEDMPEQAVQTLCMLLEDEGDHQAAMIRSGVVGSVISAMGVKNDSRLFSEWGLCALLAATDWEDGRREIVANGGIQCTCQAMRTFFAYPSILECGCRHLAGIARFEDRVRLAVAEAGGILEVTKAMRLHPFDASLQEAACVAAHNLALNAELAHKLATMGALEEIKRITQNHPLLAETQMVKNIMTMLIEVQVDINAQPPLSH